jgi:hypothetical protein
VNVYLPSKAVQPPLPAIRGCPRPLKRVAGVAYPVAVDVLLTRLRREWAVVEGVLDAVAVGVVVVAPVAEVADAVVVSVLVSGVRVPRTVVERVGIAVAVSVAVSGRRAVGFSSQASPSPSPSMSS